MFTHLVFWPWFAGLIFLTAGLVVARRELVAAHGLDKLIVLGPVFFAFPLAVFAAEHFLTPRFLAQMVPENAQRLTVELAIRSAQKDQPQTADLPKIQGKPNPN